MGSARSRLCRVGRKSVPIEELESIGESPKIVSASFPLPFLIGFLSFRSLAYGVPLVRRTLPQAVNGQRAGKFGRRLSGL